MSNALLWVNTGLDALNTGMNIHRTFGGGGGNGGGGTSHTINHNHHHERQITPEEIQMKREAHDKDMEVRDLTQAIALNEYAHNVRIRNKVLNDQKKPSDVPYWIIGGCFVLGVFLVMIKPKK